tara:strand:+ start:4513 stop:4842 length:330 start_codon:yes stop_codon:yes gene_type:complete
MQNNNNNHSNKERNALRKSILFAINNHQGPRTLSNITEALADVMLDIGLSALDIEELNRTKLQEIIKKHDKMPVLASALIIQASVIHNWIETEGLLNTSLLGGKSKDEK